MKMSSVEIGEKRRGVWSQMPVTLLVIANFGNWILMNKTWNECKKKKEAAVARFDHTMYLLY